MERDGKPYNRFAVSAISTHALRVERDAFQCLPAYFRFISTHALRVERDNLPPEFHYIEDDFNSRAPCGARLSKCLQLHSDGHFNSRAPCGARLSSYSNSLQQRTDFNSRAPCGARQGNAIRRVSLIIIFQLTRSVWSATFPRLFVFFKN